MHHEAARVFRDYQLELEHEPALLGLRLCLGASAGAVWRNAAQREHYDAAGYLATPTMDWRAVRSYFTTRQMTALNAAYRAVFTTDEVVLRTIQFGQHAARMEFLNLFGTIHAGVVLIRSIPCASGRNGNGRI